MFRRAFAVLPVLLGLAACQTAADEPIVKTTEPAVRLESDLGAPCKPGGSVNGLDPCGTKQRIAVRFVPHTMGMMGSGMTVPCTLSKATPPKEIGMGASSVATCITEGTLYANLDCMYCRIPGAGENVVAKLDELTGTQALAVQARLGLPAETPLRGEKAWRQALSPREAHASL